MFGNDEEWTRPYPINANDCIDCGQKQHSEVCCVCRNVKRLIYMQISESNKTDRTEEAFRLNDKLKQNKFKGELVLMYDGSGKVAKIKKSEYV
jgi:hypothetical protein